MVDETTKQDIIDYYSNLLIIQYHNKPKAKATIEALAEQSLMDGVLFDIQDAFDLDSAVGSQLDTLGEYIGVDRFYSGQEFSDDNFSFTEYAVTTPDPSEKGFSTYSDFDTLTGNFLQYGQIVSTDQQLNDDDYRTLLKLKIVQNNSNHSHKSIDDDIFSFFGTDVIPDSAGNMEMIYFVPSDASALILVAVEKDVLPKPIGVGLDYIVEKDEPMYGYYTYDDLAVNGQISGFSNYTDFETKEGEMLNYNKLIEVS